MSDAKFNPPKWQMNIEFTALAIQADIKRQFESLNRSIGQRFRYLRQRTAARIHREHAERLSLAQLQRLMNVMQSAHMDALAAVDVPELGIGVKDNISQRWISKGR